MTTPLLALAQGEALLLKASLNPSLSDNLATAFGNNYNVTVANNIFSSWRNGNFSNLPKIEILSSSVMNGAQGAYSASNNTIYLSGVASLRDDMQSFNTKKKSFIRCDRIIIKISFFAHIIEQMS